jgi:predicted small lipoprotein YifL
MKHLIKSAIMILLLISFTSCFPKDKNEVIEAHFWKLL